MDFQWTPSGETAPYMPERCSSSSPAVGYMSSGRVSWNCFRIRSLSSGVAPTPLRTNILKRSLSGAVGSTKTSGLSLPAASGQALQSTSHAVPEVQS